MAILCNFFIEKNKKISVSISDFYRIFMIIMIV